MLQEEQNRNNIYSLLSVFDATMKSIRSSTVDYSNWDDSYDFINTRDKKYLYENFREGTSVLEDLNVNFIIYSDKKNNEIVFSKYNHQQLKEIHFNFENAIVNYKKNSDELNTFFHFEKMVLFLSKSPIVLSDGSGQPNGHIFMGRVLDTSTLENFSNVFSTIDISFKNRKTNDEINAFEAINKVSVEHSYSGSFIQNIINFYDSDKQFVFSLNTLSKSSILNNGKDTIYIFNIIIAGAFLFITYILYRKQEAYRKVNEELYALSYKDSLTKINNRRSYFILSEKYLRRSIKERKNFSVLMVDLDNFKQINDKYGHAIGDKVLVQFTTIVNQLIDDNCIFGRIGGEEFCISFYAKSASEVSSISEQIRAKCESSPLHIHDQVINFTVSLGLAQRGSLDNIDKILKQADSLLYTAKSNGRNKLIRCSDHAENKPFKQP